MTVEVDVTEVTARLRRMSERSQQSAALNQQLEGVLSFYVDENFQNERSASGKWPPMRDITKRLRRGTTGKLLQDTGLLAAVHTDSGPDFVEVFTNVEYAKYHLKGPRRLVPLHHKTGVWILPVRDFFDIDEGEALESMAEVIVTEFARY